jgi:hypothetical protein
MKQDSRVTSRAEVAHTKARRRGVAGGRAITGKILRVRKSRGGTKYRFRTKCRHG